MVGTGCFAIVQGLQPASSCAKVKAHITIKYLLQISKKASGPLLDVEICKNVKQTLRTQSVLEI